MKSSLTIWLFAWWRWEQMLMSKMTIKMKKIGRMNLRMNFELSRSKLDYRATLMKISDKKFLTPFLRHFWLIEAKIKMKMKNFWKLSSVFDSPHESLYGNFHKNLWKIFFFLFKTFLTNRGKYEDEDKWIWENEFDFWILHYDPFFKTFFFLYNWFTQY